MFPSIIIPNLHSPVIDQTLEALGLQTWPLDHAEVIVVGLDRHSHVARFRFARLIDTEVPVSPARARNLGVRAARGDVLVFLDADAVPRKDWLSRLMAWFDEPAISVVGGSVDFAWDDEYWTVADNASHVYRFAPWAAGGEMQHLTSFSLAVRRGALDKVGLFDETFPKPAGEDTELTARLRLAGYRLIFDPHAVATHRQPRRSQASVLAKAEDFGYYSARVDPRYADSLDFPPLLRHPLSLGLAAPLLAAGLTLRIAMSTPCPRPSVWAGVYLTKLAWCRGAARRLASEAARPQPRATPTQTHGGAADVPEDRRGLGDFSGLLVTRGAASRGGR